LGGLRYVGFSEHWQIIINPIPSPQSEEAEQLKWKVKVVVKACSFTGVLNHTLFAVCPIAAVICIEDPEYLEAFSNHSWLGWLANPLG
jgi:hypothetical protein